MITSAPAKFILLGEHAVVYGFPAIAAPLNGLCAHASVHPAPVGAGLRIEALDMNEVLPVELEADAVDNALALTAQKVLKALNVAPPDAVIRVTSHIPMASGLGSGAAVSTAVARAVINAVDADIDDDALNDIIYDIEKLYHGTPSGVDNTVVVYQKPVYFLRGQPPQLLDIGGALHFIIADTGEPSLTKVTVADVRRLYDEQPHVVGNTLADIGAIVERARDAIRDGDAVALGSLMTANHHSLRALNVSSDALERLVDAAIDCGALGAKLSGGGRGGHMIALVAPDTIEAVSAALSSAGAVHIVHTQLGADHDHNP